MLAYLWREQPLLIKARRWLEPPPTGHPPDAAERPTPDGTRREKRYTH
jgi:hypothetical protein